MRNRTERISCKAINHQCYLPISCTYFSSSWHLDQPQVSSINNRMDRIAVCLSIIIGTGWPSLLLGAAEEPAQQSSAKERLNQVLDPEGGIHVYKDDQWNVESTTVLPNGERIIKVQPPPSPSMNLGPPLQLHNQTFQLPAPPPAPAQPPAPEFPQRAR